MNAYQQQQGVRATLADLAGQRIVRAELADGGCIGLTLERGELVFTAALDRRAHDVAPVLRVDWQLFTTDG